ncbi:MAG TPA: protein translocase subunit SecD [Rhizomicrobium sp.]|nr:protein translocase subunit SecD [Rhizomicrobium sp.]
MLHIPTWSRVVTFLILLAGVVIAMPNALPQSVLDDLPWWWPKGTVTLGLDLQGGSYLLMEVGMNEVQKDRIEQLKADTRINLRKAHITYTFAKTADNVESVKILDANRVEDARGILKDLNPQTGGLLTVGAREYDMSESGGNTFTLKMTEGYLTQLQGEIVRQSIEVVRKRIDQLGTREATIEQEGSDRIVIQVPGLRDPSELIKVLGTTAKMTFQLVDESANVDEAVKGNVPIGSELLYEDNPIKGGKPIPIVVERRVLVAGDRLTDARQSFSSSTGEPNVTFAFDTIGAKEFGNATKDNVNRRFAIVLDNKVIEAPVIREPIIGGRGEITGNFTVQTANELAVLLRAGALPAPLKILQQNSVGPELGEDSIQAGRISALAGLVLVALFMFARYGLFGLFADLALTLNIILLLAALTLFNATLTLPGIAGIVLTMGMAVDANVLIYERIREEQRNGRSMLASIDQGFQRARATIFDANMTHLIASLILFELGSGPVRGFAVALGVGIITSFFTAVMVTRLIVVMWLAIARPRKLAL